MYVWGWCKHVFGTGHRWRNINFDRTWRIWIQFQNIKIIQKKKILFMKTLTSKWRQSWGCNYKSYSNHACMPFATWRRAISLWQDAGIITHFLWLNTISLVLAIFLAQSKTTTTLHVIGFNQTKLPNCRATLRGGRADRPAGCGTIAASFGEMKQRGWNVQRCFS